MVKAVVFDFDGVLVNSEPLHLRAYQDVFSSLGIELTRDDYYENYLGYDDREMFRKLAQRHEWALDAAKIEALVIEKARAFDELVQQVDVLYPDAVACIERLAAHFALGIASGALRHEIEMILARAGIDRRFRFIVAAGETLNSKPWPDPYIRAAELHAAAPADCVAIEDSRWGIQSAKSAGLRCIGISTSYAPAELRSADRVIDTLEQFTVELIRSL